MKWKSTKLQTRLHLIAAGILLVGLGSAILIYITAGNAPDNIPDFENSKIYMHDLELYGGKANVLANEFRNWFAGLWQGKSLAYTIACISIIISFLIYFVANHLQSDSKSDC
ncbi:MAG TPA: hypothetical protein VEJ88_04740 [Dissulfurispiraceae bacterium]|nr:hypothetical protein [Dissulfurispiraceae bacterium]